MAPPMLIRWARAFKNAFGTKKAEASDASNLESRARLDHKSHPITPRPDRLLIQRCYSFTLCSGESPYSRS
ncbi:hypothetical protein BS47DRAFT_565450 [Hydnum rufescens UP504]|uniref:Uncharacterized protein n=1 Tax=Hydnum rufescens UP504 TaxID=1448309 RepID=A0A9P6B680_9AGAM|nr:hypothetical protein BS47DRAFT_565450 [Hydnum rufescens UP504]